MAKTQPRGEQILDNTIKLDTPNQDVTGVLPVANGGTGAASFTGNNVLLGNGTAALQNVAPGSSGNVLTSNGTTWASQAPTGGSSPNTTKGDIAGYSTTSARVPVGSDGQVLVADSGQALGIGYQTISFQARRNQQVATNPGLNTQNFYGMAAAPTITSGIAAVNSDDADGALVTISTTAVAANIATIMSAFTQLRRDWDFDISFKIKTSAQGTTTGRFWVGAFSAAPGASDTPSVHIAGFRFIGTGANTNANWVGITAAGSATQTVVDTGVAYATNTAYTLRIVSDSVAGNIKFYINGKYVGQSTTNLPTATTLLGYGISSTALAGVASSIKSGWISIMME